MDIPDRWGMLTAHHKRFGMKSRVYEQIQVRKMKAGRDLLQHAQRESGDVIQACRYFGVPRVLS